jgi:subtilisin family serine protease
MGRYFVRFKEEAQRAEVASFLAPTSSPYAPLYASRTESELLIVDLGPEERSCVEQAGAQVFEDVLFHPVVTNPVLPDSLGEEWQYWEPGPAPMMASPFTQADVVRHVKAPEAWATTTGQGATIAIVDSGISGAHAEFPLHRRSPRSLSFSFDNPWEDSRGHGSMCASVAAASVEMGGRYNGVAPGATLLSARTTLFAGDIYKLFDTLTYDYKQGRFNGPLVISNSYGSYVCTATDVPDDHPYLDVVRGAVSAGITVVFAAGNNHADVLCGHDPVADGPNTIWGVNSVDEVITVGTVSRDNTNQEPGPHANSSRGPGQWATRTKPDLVAPTYGEVVWGDHYRVLDWWGTSGACPQVAGAAALVLSVNPTMLPEDVTQVLRDTADPLPAPDTCVGSGLLNCAAAVTAAA